MKIVALGELLEPAQVKRAGSTELPVLSMTMHEGLVTQSDRFKKRIASLDTSEYKVVKRGQLVVGFPIDEGVLDFQMQHDEAVVSPAYGIWNVRDDTLVDRSYLKLFLTSPRAITYYTGKMKGSTARRRSLPASEFRAMPVPLPTLPEQRRIAAILDRADALRAKRRQVLAHLDALTSATFESMFNGRESPLTPIGDHIIDQQIGLVRSGALQGQDRQHDYLRMDAITGDGKLDLSNVTRVDATPSEVAKYSVRDGDLLLNTRNSRELVGKTAVYRGKPRLYNNNIMRIRFSNTLRADYVHQFLWSSSGQRQLEARKSGTTSVFAVYGKSLATLLVPIPPLSSQVAFTERAAVICRQRLSIERALAGDDELFASLQSRAFRGEL